MRGLKPDLEFYAARHSWVASFTDAWIETIVLLSYYYDAKSHLLQMRGLKPG